MMKTEDKTRNACSEERILIKEEWLTIAGRTVRYALYEHKGSRSQYEIGIRTDEEDVRSFTGQSFPRAAKLFTLMVEGEVTPCSFYDILEDLPDRTE